MAEAKTKPTTLAATDHLAQIADATRRADCEILLELMRRVTGEPAVMWGPSIVGFGRYRYTYDSGHSGESCLTGFASRKGDISVYLFPGVEGQEGLLARLGKHKMGKACLSIRRLADIDLKVLEQLIIQSIAEVKRRYPAEEGTT